MAQETIKWMIAGGGWVVALIALLVGYFERKQAREEDALQKTLSYFTGGTQKRSIGIGLVEGIWIKEKKFLGVLVPIISNQIVYLLITTKSKEEAHEERNLIRLLFMLKEVPNLKETYNQYYCDVLDAIGQKLEGTNKGLLLSEQTLKSWENMLNNV